MRRTQAAMYRRTWRIEARLLTTSYILRYDKPLSHSFSVIALFLPRTPKSSSRGAPRPGSRALGADRRPADNAMITAGSGGIEKSWGRTLPLLLASGQAGGGGLPWR